MLTLINNIIINVSIRKKAGPGQVNFALGKVKMDTLWPGGEIKLSSVYMLCSNWAGNIRVDVREN